MTKAFYDSFFGTSAGEGSNNWAVSRAPDGKRLLANDTHMTVMVPNIWYISHLNSPDMHTAGFSIPGSPGILIGHNERVAWGFTNLTLDGQDLFVLETDPRDPRRYRVDETWYAMEEGDITVVLPNGTERVLPAYRTIFGPVITELSKEAEAVVALKWYGSLDETELVDHSTHGFFELARAASVAEVIEAGASFAYVGQNIIAADSEGHIGYHALGAVPLRAGYSGRLPAYGSGGGMDWTGFVPYEQFPGRVDPPEGWLATANNRVTTDSDPYPISFSWSDPYRVERIGSLLASSSSPSVERFGAMRMDVYSPLADAVLERIMSYPVKDPLAENSSSQYDRSG